MRLRFAIAAVLMLLAAPAQAQADPAAVQQSFSAYKQALIDGNGAAASALTASDTHAYLEQTLDRAPPT